MSKYSGIVPIFLNYSALLLLVVMSGCSTLGETSKSFSRLELADRAYSEGRWVEAEQHYLAITEAAPNDFYAWFRLGNCRLHQGNVQAAIHAYEYSLQRDPRQAKPYHNMAEAYLILAYQSLERAKQLSEDRSYARSEIDEKLTKLKNIIYKPVSDIPSPAQGLIKNQTRRYQ